jgi:hypothetical protein
MSLKTTICEPLANRNSRRLLAPVLQRVEAEVGELGDLFMRCPDAEDATCVLGSPIVWIQVVVQQTITLCHYFIVSVRPHIMGSCQYARMSAEAIYLSPAMESAKLARTEHRRLVRLRRRHRVRVVDLTVSNLFNFSVVIGAVFMFADGLADHWLGAVWRWRR